MHKLLKIFFTLLFFITVDGFTQLKKLQHYAIFDGSSNLSIHQIVQDEIGYLWLATNQGVFQFDGIRFSKRHNQDSNTIYTKKSTLYIGHSKGLTIRKGDDNFFFENKKINKIIPIQNNIFLATTEGISIVKDDFMQPLSINTTLDFSIIYDIIYLNKHFYIASNKGFWMVDQLINPKKVKKITELNFQQLLQNKNIIIAVNNENGLYQINKNSKIQSIYEFSDIYAITRFNEEIWITTNGNGIEIINSNTYRFIRKINKYNSKVSDTLTSLFIDRQNLLWIGSSNGIYKYTSHTNSKTPSLTLNFEKIAVNFATINHIKSKKLKLSSSDNNISFSFKSIDFKNPENIEYQYQLNSKLSPWNSQNNVEFANLKPGDYTFTVQSKNGSLLSKKLSYTFSIDSPIYQEVWFYILIFSVLCLIAAYSIDARIKKMQKKNLFKIEQLELKNHLMSLEQKALQLQMNPHFIFNVLNGIKALGNSGKSKELNTTISQFSVLLRSVLNNSRLEEINLQDEIETLTNYLNLEQKMSSVNFTYSIKQELNNIDAEEILIPPMLIQPFIENSIKHAFNLTTENPKIDVLFEVKQQFLHFTITDNGIGYTTTKNKKNSHKSVALQITKERIQNLTPYHKFNISLLKEQQKIKGTKICFKIPLKTDY